MGNAFHHFFCRPVWPPTFAAKTTPEASYQLYFCWPTQKLKTQLILKCFSRKVSCKGQQRDRCGFSCPSRELQTTSSAPVHAVPCSHSPPLLDGHSPSQRSSYPVSAISCRTLKNESKDLELGFKSMRKQCQGGHQDSVLSETPYPAQNGVTQRIYSILKGNRNSVSERWSHGELRHQLRAFSWSVSPQHTWTAL